MSWLNLNQSLNSLKGQITNFASEVLLEGPGPDSSGASSNTDVPGKELEEKCRNQELEIAALKKLNEELEATLQSERLARKNGVREEDNNWYWDPPPQPANNPQQCENQIKILQDELSALKQAKNDFKHEELEKLREENRNLTANLEDLDQQHQLAMERLLTLKKELQKNFEVLKQEHEELKSNNDEFAQEREMLLKKLGERDKEIEELNHAKIDYENLHHKYLNLEKVHSLLRENAEKFQEENQELHEEVFQLQEQVTKIEHDLEIAAKHSELSNAVPRESYDELLKELNELKERKHSNKVHLDEINIDDNAKSVIESLKREIRELKLKLSQKDEVEHSEHKVIKTDYMMQLYNKYINFELPVDYIGEMPSNDNNAIIKVENAFKALNAFKKDIATLEHQLSEKNHNINHLQTQIDDLTSENDFLTSDVHHFETELNEMKKNNDFLISEIAALKNTSKLEPIIESHEDNLAKLESELDTCNKINKSFESEIRRIEKELEDVKIEKVVLQQALADMRSKYTVMLNELENVKTQTKAVEELENSTNVEHSEKFKKATDEIDELRKKVHTANAKNEQLSIDNHIIENDKVLLIKEVDELKHTLADTLAAHKDLETLKSNLHVKLEDVENKLEQVTRHRKDLEKDKQKLEEKLTEKIEKTNESVQAELQQLTTEKSQLVERIKKLLHENSTLKISFEDLTKELTTLRNVDKEIVAERDALKNATKNECEDTVALHETIKELQSKILEDQVIKDTLLEEKQKLIERKIQLEMELTSTDTKISNLEQEFEKLIQDLNDKDSIIITLNANYAEVTSKLNESTQMIADLNKTIEIKNEELQKLTKLVNDTQEKLAGVTLRTDRSFEELKHLQIEKEDYNKQILNLHDQIANLNNDVSNLHHQIDTAKGTIDSKDKEIKELNQSIVEMRDKIKSTENCSHVNDEYANLIQERDTMEKELTDLKNYVYTKENEMLDYKQNMDELEKTCQEYKNASDVAVKEKAELINLINLKHNESIQYHNEIQRLNHVLLEQTNEFKRIVEEKDAAIHIKSEACANCENLRITLKEKDEIIKNLNQNNTEYEPLRSELQKANETIKSLQEKCNALEMNLTTQLENIKTLTAKNAQLSEQEQTSTKELERLRRHLVEMEESYTQELMTSEQKLTECQSRLHQIEERAKQNSTVYTSNSIRANQEVETLRNQIKLMEKQREDVQNKLSEAEDGRIRSEAALTNLQVVLEQFQMDKERDIATATEKIRNKMEDIKRDNLNLKSEISRLNAKLEEASAGLQAAARLGDQVETKTAQINDLKEQVKTLQISVAAAEERYYNATSNQQDKIDKNLVKNLVINYVVTATHNPNNKIQVLRILSTVLDFNQQECERLGLSRSNTSTDSLAAEFVKFLQNESTPRAPLPNIMGIAQGSRSVTPVSRRNSTLGPQPNFEVGHKRNASNSSNNLLFQNIDNLETSSQISLESDSGKRALETGVTQPRDTEGAILKHVLRDM